MPYIFPDRVPRANDNVDKDQLTNDFGDIAEYAVTELSEHNFKEAVPSSVADSSIYKVMLLGPVYAPVGFGAPDPSTGHNNPPEVITGWNANSKSVPNSNTWELVDSITTFEAEGPELIHLVGFLNYGWTGFTPPGARGVLHNHMYTHPGGDTSIAVQPLTTPHVIFALRVNGTIYNKTGQRNPTYRPYLPIRADGESQTLHVGGLLSSPTRINFGGWPGMISLRGNVTSHPGYALFNVGFDVLVPVPSGDVKIEIVALRLNKLKRSKFAANDFIVVNSRCLAAVRYFTDPVRERRTAPVAYTPIKAGNTLSTATLKTNNLDPIKNKLNNLTESDVGKLNRYHMPKVLHENGSNELLAKSEGKSWVGSPFLIYNFCPGENVGPVQIPHTSHVAAPTSWGYLTNPGAATEFFLAPSSGSIPTNSASHRGVLIVTGRIIIQEIRKHSLSTFWGGADGEQHMACVGIYYRQTDGTRTLIPASVVPVCRRSMPDADDTKGIMVTGNLPARQDVTLMAVIDTRTSLLATALDGFGICVSAINTQNKDSVKIQITQAHLSYEFYKE